MRKAIVIPLVFILTIAVSMTMITPARASIENFTWLPTYVEKGYVGDPYYDYVVIYKDGTTASLLVPVSNDAYPTKTLNVSKVIINFYDMGKNKTLDYSASPHPIEYNVVEYFTVSFTADLAEAGASSLAHEYRVYVEHVNATTGPKIIVGTWTLYWDDVYPDYLFVVWSTAQADAIDSLAKYNSYEDYYYWYDWESIGAQQKSTQAVIEKGLGDTYYGREDYDSALTQYDLANTLWEAALAAEKDWRTASDNADLNATLTDAAATLKEADATVITANAALTEANAAVIEANATKVQADAALTNAYGWYFIGLGFAIGWSFMGIGVIIYALRKPKIATT